MRPDAPWVGSQIRGPSLIRVSAYKVGSVSGGELREGENAIFLFVRQLAYADRRFDSHPRHALSPLLSLIYKGFSCVLR